MAALDRVDDPSSASDSDWIGVALDEAQQCDGTAYIAAVVQSILAHVETDLSAAGNQGEAVDLVEVVQGTLLPTWNLCWQIYHRQIPLSSYFRKDGLAAAFTSAGDDALAVLVAAQLYFDYATFVRNYEPLAEGLRALDAALPAGTGKEDFALFRAVEVLSSVHESCIAARSEILAADSPETTGRTVALPSSATVLAIEQAAIDEDAEITQGRRPATIKTLSYLMRTVELLPMPDSAAGKQLVRVEDFYRLIMDQAMRSLHRDGRSDNGNSDVHYRCARVHHALGEIDDALDALREAMSLVDDSNVYVTEQYFTFHRDLEQEQSIQRRVEAQINAFDDVLAKNLAESKQQVQEFAQEAANNTRREISRALFCVAGAFGISLGLIGWLSRRGSSHPR